MSKKTISKVIIYYEDGTYEEVKAGFYPVHEKSPINPHRVDFRPDVQKMREWVCAQTEMYPLKFYSIGDNKYPITSTGNGNVDISKRRVY